MTPTLQMSRENCIQSAGSRLREYVYHVRPFIATGYEEITSLANSPHLCYPLTCLQQTECRLK
jgi:hypothetical protein